MVAKLKAIKAELRRRMQPHGRCRCLAPEGCTGLLPIPRCSREHDSVTYLQTSRLQAMAECSGPP
jgi:hypothetical protein